MAIKYAYLNKDDPTKFGLLEAVDYEDARIHLGSRYYIKKMDLPDEDFFALPYDDETIKRIISPVFEGKQIVALHPLEW